MAKAFAFEAMPTTWHGGDLHFVYESSTADLGLVGLYEAEAVESSIGIGPSPPVIVLIAGLESELTTSAIFPRPDIGSVTTAPFQMAETAPIPIEPGYGVFPLMPARRVFDVVLNIEKVERAQPLALEEDDLRW